MRVTATWFLAMGLAWWLTGCAVTIGRDTTTFDGDSFEQTSTAYTGSILDVRISERGVATSTVSLDQAKEAMSPEFAAVIDTVVEKAVRAAMAAATAGALGSIDIGELVGGDDAPEVVEEVLEGAVE